MGPQGPAGADGAGGATGPIGPQGPAGADGAVGATGPIGPQGPAGAAGATGPQGPVGATGATGAVGPRGPSQAWAKSYRWVTGVAPTLNANTWQTIPELSRIEASDHYIFFATLDVLATNRSNLPRYVQCSINNGLTAVADSSAIVGGAETNSLAGSLSLVGYGYASPGLKVKLECYSYGKSVNYYFASLVALRVDNVDEE